MLRRRLKKGPSAVSEDTLIALWCAIDADDSDQVYPQEFGAFLRRGAADFKSKAPDNLNKRNIELGGAQTAGLGRALESTPTAEMRAKLEAPLNEDQMLVWAKQFCKWLEMSLYKKNLSVHTWFNLFSEIDEDGSGFVTFDEFEDVVRHRLGQSVKKVPDETVRAIWCALDTDDSNQIMPQEMGKWLKQGADEVTSKAPKNLNKKKIELGGAQTAGLGRALASTPTAEMRASLEAPLTEEELDDLSKKVTSWLEELMYKKNMATHSWFNLFKEADEDGMARTAQPLQSTRTYAVSLCGCVQYMPLICARPLSACANRARVCTCIRSACPGSGFITFDELEDILRRKAKKGPSFLSDEKLRALWCALDSDDSNQIMPQEMGKFLKRAGGESIKVGKGPSNLNKKKIELGGSADLAKGRALECTQTAVLRASLKAELSPEELIELQKTLNLKLTESLHKKSIEVTSAYQLFREIDKDGSGFITWDE